MCTDIDFHFVSLRKETICNALTYTTARSKMSKNLVLYNLKSYRISHIVILSPSSPPTPTQTFGSRQIWTQHQKFGQQPPTPHQLWVLGRFGINIVSWTNNPPTPTKFG